MSSGMNASDCNMTASAATSSTLSSSMSMGSSMEAAQCSPMLDGFQFAFGSLSSSSSSSCILYLFPGANVNTPFKYAVALLGTCGLAMCYELLRAHREQLVAWKNAAMTSLSTLQPQPQQQLSSSFLPDHDLLIAVLYTIQSMLGYVLMMLVMTYDISLFVAICTGLGVGYYCVLRQNRSTVSRQESVAHYKLMLTPTSAAAAKDHHHATVTSTLTTAVCATTPSPSIMAAEAC